MQLKSLLRSAAMMAVLAVLSLLLFQTAQSQAQAVTETVFYNFCGVDSCLDGGGPIGPLAAVGGTFYGVSTDGGLGCSNGPCGTAFGLFPEPSGGCETGTNTGNGWCEFVLYNFCSLANCADGSWPLGNVSYLNARFNRPGNFYGTTYYGGSHNLGTVFEISSKPVLSGCPAGSNQSGGWCETVLYSFCSYNIGITCSDGYHPGGNLVEDSAGNLYGVVVGEAQNGVGGVFELSPDQQGGYDEELIYPDDFIQIGLAIDSDDNLYGTDTNFTTGQANVFKIALSQASYPQTNIYTFSGSEGFPTGVTVDSAGNLYGATYTGGSKNLGTVWKLIPVTTGKKAGTYTKKTLHNFTAEKGGEYPETGVTLDSSGNIYGTAIGGNTGCPGGCGTLFELAADGDTYKYKLLWSFNGTDGAGPDSPTVTSAGTLYGVTGSGGANNSGTMFELTF
jgi:uncharacterized repeat protein (TIGR03803 family)